MRIKLCLFLLLSSIGYSQSIIPDSLFNSNVEIKINYLIEKANNENNLKLINNFYTIALQLAEDKKNDSLYLATYQKKVFHFYTKGDYNKMVILADSLLLYSKDKNNLFYQYRAKTLLANGNKMLFKQDTSLKNYQDALNIANKIKDSLLIGDAYNNLGDAYMNLERFAEAEEYFKVALSIYDDIKADESEKYITYKNLSRVVKSPEETIFYLNKALQTVKKENNPHKLSAFYLTSGDAYINKDMPNQALDALNKSYSIADSINYTVIKNISLIALSRANLKLGKYEEAIRFGNLALKDSMIGPKNKHHVFFSLYNAYAGIEDYKNAYAFAEKAYNLQDSLNINQANANYAEYDARFNVEQKDKEIAQQQLEIAKQKNTRNQWVFGSIAALLLVLGVFQWFSSKQKRKKIAIENELQKEQEINDLRSKFLGNIAHEIRTPLTLITGNLDLALENFDKKEQAKKNVAIALENSKRVTQDANEILELLKFEKSKVTVNKETVEVDKILKRMVFAFKSLADIKQIEITYTSNLSDEDSYNIDIEKTEKIINNLMSNAIKHSPSNSVILVNSILENNRLTVEVKDQGMGINFNEQDKIFERFYQSKSNEAIGGIGIGLSLSRELANLMDGTLQVKSEPNKGSTFMLSLPIEKAYVENKKGIYQEGDIVVSKPKEKEQIIKENSFNNASILIVEDNPQMANYLKELLENDFKCTVAFDGEEALNKLETESFDLITSDIMMPKLNGFQLREKINQSETLKSIPFILISAKTLEEDKVKGFMLGIDDYIVKPFNKNELLARVKNLLSNKREREQWKIDNSGLISDTTSADEKLLKQLETTVIENLSNEEFSVKELAQSANYSQRQLTRIIKQYTGMTPVKFILEIRLQKAYQLLKYKSYFTLSEVRYDIGISSSPYFNKKFKERYGIKPAEMLIS